MIARIWQGRVSTAQADAYAQYLFRTGIAEFQAAAGCRGVTLLRRVEDTQTQLLVLSLWESLDALTQVLGPDVNQARLYAEDEDFLIERATTATHYEVVYAEQGG